MTPGQEVKRAQRWRWQWYRRAALGVLPDHGSRWDAELLSRGHGAWAGTVRFTPAFTAPVKPNYLLRNGHV